MLELDLFSLDEIEAMVSWFFVTFSSNKASILVKNNQMTLFSQKKSLQETIGCFEHSDTESLSPVPASAATTNPFLQSLPVQAEEYVTEVSTPISNGDTGIHTTMQPSFPKVSTSFSPGQGNISMDLSPELSPITGPNMTPKLQLPPVPPRRTSKQAPIRIPSHVVASWHNSKPHDNSMELFAKKARENFTSPKTNGVKKGANGDMHLSNGLSRSQDAPATCTAGAHPKWEKAENSHAQWPELKSHFQNHKNFADNLKSRKDKPWTFSSEVESSMFFYFSCFSISNSKRQQQSLRVETTTRWRNDYPFTDSYYGCSRILRTFVSIRFKLQSIRTSWTTIDLSKQFASGQFHSR